MAQTIISSDPIQLKHPEVPFFFFQSKVTYSICRFKVNSNKKHKLCQGTPPHVCVHKYLASFSFFSSLFHFLPFFFSSPAPPRLSPLLHPPAATLLAPQTPEGLPPCSRRSRGPPASRRRLLPLSPAGSRGKNADGAPSAARPRRDRALPRGRAGPRAAPGPGPKPPGLPRGSPRRAPHPEAPRVAPEAPHIETGPGAQAAEQLLRLHAAARPEAHGTSGARGP